TGECDYARQSVTNTWTDLIPLLFFPDYARDDRDLPSFPTRRSSDLNPLFQKEDIEKEKGVILEELKMEVDNPEYLIHEIFSSHLDRKSTRLNSSHVAISYAVFCLKKKNECTRGIAVAGKVQTEATWA